MASDPSPSAAPGVYLDVAIRKPKPSFETGVPAFLGCYWSTDDVNGAHWSALRSRFGGRVIPVDAPLWSMIEAGFTASPSQSAFGFAVRGFFQNGGRRCYIVAPEGSRAAGIAPGLEELEALTDFDLLCAPDMVKAGSASELATAQRRILEYCALRGDCFAILDSLPTPGVDPANEITQVKNHRAALAGAVGQDSAALYIPWVKAPDAGFIPPCGHVAGVYARTDTSVGVYKAPANEALSGVIDLQRKITAAEQDSLNPAGIDCIRAFPGRGMRIWGARTLGSDASQAFVNVRRLILTIRRWLRFSMAGVAFEPNNQALWIRISRELDGFLGALYQKGALRGQSPAEAYSVQCDAETNPPEVRAAGKVVAEIGVAARAPGELIRLRVVLGRDDAPVGGGA